jgi:hypothetical protein
MSLRHHHCYPAQTYVHPTQYNVQDYYYPQVIHHIHPLHTVNVHHNVYSPQHSYTYSQSNVPGYNYYTGY